MNYPEGHARLLKLKIDITADCLRFLVVNFVNLSAISDTWEWMPGIPFLGRYILSLSAIPNALLKLSFSQVVFLFSFIFFL